MILTMKKAPARPTDHLMHSFDNILLNNLFNFNYFSEFMFELFLRST